VPLRDLAPGLEKVGAEQFVHEPELDDLVRHPQLFGVMAGQRDLPVVVLGSVAEAQGHHDLMLLMGGMESDHRIHSPADQDCHLLSAFHD